MQLMYKAPTADQKNRDIVLPPGGRNMQCCRSILIDNIETDRFTTLPGRGQDWGATTLGEIEITAILDSMGNQMYSWPRSPCMSSKEFGSFHRPPLTATGLLIHGHLAMMALSPNLVTSGSSRTAEVLCAGLTKLADKLDFRNVWINLQADNCSKEVKNVGVLRVLALWTALHKVRGCEVSFLSSGHSHEDIDGLFNLIRAHIETYRELLTPLDFKNCIQAF